MMDIAGRKADHLDLTTHADVGFRRTTLLECVEFIHDSLPELDYAELEPSVEVLGKRLAAPIVIAAMTGGTERARIINQGLAQIAEELGLGFGLGSQRPMLLDPFAAESYRVRNVAPTALVLGNVGAVQVAQMSTSAVREMVDSIGADALCIHLNPAMELIQIEGDRDFRGVADRIARLVDELPFPVIVKETGSGISGSVARRLRARGVRHVDVSGAGGTSWVAVETERVPLSRRSLGETFREWGIPTAASIGLCAREGFDTVIATGGIASGLDVARAIALGATVAGIARPVLIAHERGGIAEVRAYLERVQTELRTAMLLVSARTISDLRAAPRLIHAPLTQWLTASV
ncbi:MAG: type 2 isopentenyl-diphosphate Delta-isomerase [Polyangiaceae bacterium]